MEEGVSVIIPAFNNGHTIKNTLQSLREQDYGGILEIVIVDDFSSDNTAEITKSMGLNPIQNPANLGLAASLNRGISESKNDIIVTLHADATPLSKNWLSRLVKPLMEANAGASCSLQYPPDCDGSQLSVWEKFLWGKLEPHHALNDKADAYRREVFEQAGAFDQARFRTAGEDEDMALRLRLTGIRIEATSAEIRHDHRFETKSERQRFLKIMGKEYDFGRCGGALRRKFPKHKPGAYVYPTPKSPLNDGAFRVLLCFGSLIPYLQLLCIPSLVTLSLVGIVATNKRTRVGFALLLYPFFNLARFWCYSLGYLHGLFTGKQT